MIAKPANSDARTSMKKYLATVLVLSSFVGGGVMANQVKNDIVVTPISTFNKENLKIIKNNELTNDILKIITYSQDGVSQGFVNTAKLDYAQMYSDANEKFTQGNITVAYKMYKDVIFATAKEDFVSLGLAYKFASIGLFTLAQEAINNIQDRELYKNQIQLIKSRLFPQVVLSYDNEIFLAQNYTEIYYNNLAFEVTRDMSKMSEHYKRSDYAHYILSQAYYNTKEYNKAINEINKSLSINPDNANYLKYKAQIFCETNRLSESIKILDSLLSTNVDMLDYRNDIEGLRYYTLAKATKDRVKSSYYLANYFIKSGDDKRAIKELNQNISTDKNDYQSLSLLANINFRQNNLADAMDNYEKAYKIKKNDSQTLVGIADMYLFKKDYKNALDFYLKAIKKNKNDTESMIKASLCYKMLNISDKSVEYANKALAKENISVQTYYIASKINDIKNIQYLKKTVSINPMHIDAWLDLVDISLKNNRDDLAKIYLDTVKYLNKKDARYYYYSGLLNKKNGLNDEAVKDLKKAIELNALFDEAIEALKSIPVHPILTEI